MATDNKIILKGKYDDAGVPQKITNGHASGLSVGELAVNTSTTAANHGHVFLGVSHTYNSNATDIALGAATTDEYRAGQTGGIVWVGAPILDQDNFSSDSAYHLATQQSIKAYVDTATAANRDIDALSAFSGVPHATDDEFLISDAGTEKRATTTMVANGVFALVGEDITIAAGGDATIGAEKVHGSMLNNDAISGQGAMGAAPANDDELLLSDGGVLKSLTIANLAANSSFASATTVSDNSGSTAMPVVFHDESNNLHDDTGTFTYKPSTGMVTATGFTGALTGNASGSSATCTGNAATATALATARTIGGTSFDGTGNIAVGLAGTATALATARNINGTSFDGTGNITITAAGSTLSDTVTVAKGGTGATSFADKSVIISQDSSTDTLAAAAMTTSGNILVGGASGPAVTTITGGSNITVTNGDGTIAIAGSGNDNDDVSVANLKTRLAGGFGSNAVTIGDSGDVVTIGNDLIVTGDLTISGDTVTANVATLDVEDNNITLNKSSSDSSATADGAGITIQDAVNASTDATILWTASSDTFTFSHDINADVTGDVTGDLTGNADTATALATARTIGGTSFDGTGNITPANATLAATATALATARTIGGTSFDGTGNITPANATNAANIYVNEDNTGDTSCSILFTQSAGGANRAVYEDSGLTYDNTNNNLTTTTFTGALAGNASTATALATARTIGGTSFDGTGNIAVNLAATATILATARTIGGVSFNGSANIDLPGVNSAGNQNTSGSAATLTNARTIGGVSFNGSANIDLPGVNSSGSQDTSGNAATATKIASITNSDIVQLTTAQTLTNKTIGGGAYTAA